MKTTPLWISPGADCWVVRAADSTSGAAGRRVGRPAPRVRPDARDKSGRTLCLTVVGDNLRLGAATNAVRVASRWFKSADTELQA